MALTLTAGSTVTYADTVAAFTESAGKYWLSAKADNAEYQKQEIDAPATDGVFIKRHGFRSRKIVCTVCYVNDTAAALLTAYQNDLNTLENVVFTCAVPDGATYPACELVSMRPATGPKGTGTGKFYFIVTIEIEQKRLA